MGALKIRLPLPVHCLKLKTCFWWVDYDWTYNYSLLLWDDNKLYNNNSQSLLLAFRMFIFQM